MLTAIEVIKMILAFDKGEISGQAKDIHPELDAFVKAFYQEHGDIMKALENL